jgi:hypothetical protein
MALRAILRLTELFVAGIKPVRRTPSTNTNIHIKVLTRRRLEKNSIIGYNPVK